MTTDKVEKLSFLYKIMDTADDGSYKLLDSLSGVLNINGEELLYHVIFVKKKRMYSPVAVLSNGEIIEVINRASEAMSEVDGKGKPRYDKPSKVPPDLRYHYFKYQNMFYKFNHSLLWTDEHSINTVSNQIISYVINEKMFTKDLFNDLIDEVVSLSTYYIDRFLFYVSALQSNFPPENQAPNAPIVYGPTQGKIGETYGYSAVSSDPDDDNLYYYFDWGDGTGDISTMVNL